MLSQLEKNTSMQAVGKKTLPKQKKNLELNYRSNACSCS